MSEALRTIEVLDPSVPPRQAKFTLAARPDTLNGKALGLLSNGKPNAALFLGKVAALLSERYQFSQVIAIDRDEGRPGEGAATKPVDWLAAKCDVVVTGVGD